MFISGPKKDGPRRQISDVSTASECSSSQPHPPKSRGGSIPCPPAGNPNSAPSQQDQDSQSRSTAPKSSSVNNNRTTAKNKTITRTGTATQHGAPYTNAPQVNSLNRISPTSTTATNVAMGTRSKSRKSFAISAKPLDDNNATVSSKGDLITCPYLHVLILSLSPLNIDCLSFHRNNRGRLHHDDDDDNK